MSTYRITYWPPADRRLVEDVVADEARVEGGHRLVLRRWVVVALSARLVVVRRVDLRRAVVDELRAGPSGHHRRCRR